VAAPKAGVPAAALEPTALLPVPLAGVPVVALGEDGALTFTFGVFVMGLLEPDSVTVL
jgi:hypothetical protein